MAGAGYKLYATGDVLSATDVNTYLQQQTVMNFASSAARTTALSGVLAEGMVSYLQDTNAVEVYNGSAWVSAGGATGSMTSIASGSLSGNTLSLTSISGSYKNLQLLLRDVSIDAQSPLYCTFNGLSANYFDSNYGHHTTTTAFNEGNVNRAFAVLGGYENQVANTTVTAHVLDFYDYTSSDVKICRKSGYIDGRFSTPYLYNSTFGNYASGARAAITSITITINNGGNYNGGTYILYGVN